MANICANMKRCFSPPALRAYFAEFFSTFLFVFIAVGSTISARKSCVSLQPTFRMSCELLCFVGLIRDFAL